MFRDIVHSVREIFHCEVAQTDRLLVMHVDGKHNKQYVVKSRRRFAGKVSRNEDASEFRICIS